MSQSLSVITVVYNDVANIERTIQSVLNQTYPHIEYLVIDGESTDGTLEVIKKYEGKLNLISEKDNGIYDAMNKGLSRATCDYVLFMNSGDEIYDINTAQLVFASHPGADIYYGETQMLGPNLENLGRRRHRIPEELRHASFRYGMSVSHQAIYIRRSIVGLFDTTYQLSADIDWILQAVKNSRIIINTHLYVAKYLTGGMSKKRHLESLKERFQIFTNHYGLLPNLFNHLVIAAKLGWYFLIHKRTND